jgi:phage terminase small subunit
VNAFPFNLCVWALAGALSVAPLESAEKRDRVLEQLQADLQVAERDRALNDECLNRVSQQLKEAEAQTDISPEIVTTLRSYCDAYSRALELDQHLVAKLVEKRDERLKQRAQEASQLRVPASAGSAADRELLAMLKDGVRAKDDAAPGTGPSSLELAFAANVAKFDKTLAREDQKIEAALEVINDPVRAMVTVRKMLAISTEMYDERFATYDKLKQYHAMLTAFAPAAGGLLSLPPAPSPPTAYEQILKGSAVAKDGPSTGSPPAPVPAIPASAPSASPAGNGSAPPLPTAATPK